MHCQSGKKNHQPEPIPGRISASRESGKSTPVTKPYSFWGCPNLRKTQKTQHHRTLQLLRSSKPSQNPKTQHRPLPKRQKRTTTLNPYLAGFLLQEKLGGKLQLQDPTAFEVVQTFAKPKKHNIDHHQSGKKKTTTLNPYLAGFLLQEKLGGKLQLQDPTAFEVVQTFAKPKKHKVDHCQSGKKEPQP